MNTNNIFIDIKWSIDSIDKEILQIIYKSYDIYNANCILTYIRQILIPLYLEELNDQTI